MIAQPRLQRKHKYIDRRINDWLAIHYGDTSFNGRITITVRNRNGYMETVSCRSLKELQPYINLMHISPRCDYYLTGNSVSGVSRLKQDLFGLHNIVIDVDCHDKKLRDHEIEELIQRFIWRANRDCWGIGELPYPNSIVRTGQGIHLWWAIVPCHVSCVWYYDHVKVGFMERLRDLIDEFPELNGLTVDSTASSNNVGLYRMPYTYHTGRKCRTKTKIIHNSPFKLQELTQYVCVQNQMMHISKEPAAVAMDKRDLKLLQNFYTVGSRRIAKFIKLRNYRNQAVGNETRNNFCLAVYCELRRTFEHEEAMTYLHQFNAGFKEPMTEKELQNTLCSAQQKGGYKYSNKKLIELLEITEEEQAIIGLFPMPTHKAFAKPNATRDEVRRIRREGRDAKILDLFETGMSKSEIARQLEINRKTVATVLKKHTEEETVPSDDQPVEQGENLSKNGSFNDNCFIEGDPEGWFAWDEGPEEVSIPHGQYTLSLDYSTPRSLAINQSKVDVGDILVLPRPGPLKPS